MRGIERLLRRGGDRVEIDRVVHHPHAGPRHAERGHQIVGHALRRRDDQIGRRIAGARGDREQRADASGAARDSRRPRETPTSGSAD